jgi:hypothetical protein
MPKRLPARAISKFFTNDNPSLSKYGLLLVHTFPASESNGIADAIQKYPSDFRLDNYGNIQCKTAEGSDFFFSTHPLFSPDSMEDLHTLKGRVDNISTLAKKHSPYVYSVDKVTSPNTRFVLMRHDGLYSLTYNVLHTSEFSEYYQHERTTHMTPNNTNWGKHYQLRTRLENYLKKQIVTVGGEQVYLDPASSMFIGQDEATAAAVTGKNLVTFPNAFTHALDKAAYDIYKNQPPGKRSTALCEGPIQRHMKTHFPESFLEQGKFSGSNIELECEVRHQEITICSQVIGGDYAEVNSTGSNFVNQCNNDGDFIVNKEPDTDPTKDDPTNDEDSPPPPPSQSEKYMILLIGGVTFLAISVWIMTTPSRSKRASA